MFTFQDPLPDELGGTLKGFHLEYRKYGASTYLKKTLTSSTHKYTLTGLKVFTKYEVKIAAYNEKGSGKSTPPYRATTGELGECACVDRAGSAPLEFSVSVC